MAHRMYEIYFVIRMYSTMTNTFAGSVISETIKTVYSVKFAVIL